MEGQCGYDDEDEDEDEDEDDDDDDDDDYDDDDEKQKKINVFQRERSNGSRMSFAIHWSIHMVIISHL